MKAGVAEVAEVAKGFALDFVLDEAAQSALDQGNYKTANALNTGHETLSAVGQGLVGGTETVLGGIDALAQKLTGTKPLGSVAAFIAGRDKPVDFLQAGIEDVDQAGGHLAKAIVNAESVVTGDQFVAGRQKGGSTVMGDLLGYGSLSQHAGEPSTFDLTPPGGHGQTPGNSGYSPRPEPQQQAPMQAAPASIQVDLPAAASVPASDRFIDGGSLGQLPTLGGGLSDHNAIMQQTQYANLEQTQGIFTQQMKQTKIANKASLTNYMENKKQTERLEDISSALKKNSDTFGPGQGGGEQ